MSKKEKYKRYGYEDAYDTEKENNWPNRLSLDDCIEIMNNQFNEIVELKQQLVIKDRMIMLILKNTYYLDKEYFIEEIPTQDEYIVSQTKYWTKQAKRWKQQI